MASGLIRNGSTVYYADDTVSRSFTLNNGYYNLGNGSAIPIPSGAKIIAVGINYWSSNSGAFSLVRYANNQVYAIGTNGVTVSGLKCRFWYTL